DTDGVRLPYVGTAGQKWKETTLTLAYMPTASFELRGEIRGDSSNEAVFLNSDGTAKTDQTSFGLEALYKF
ncbi:MAG: outer membrane beta-barrel protein, partial [Gallionellaceae bacterium]